MQVARERNSEDDVAKHWRARAGQILIRDENDEWHWVTPASKSSADRFARAVAAVTITLLVVALLLFLYAASRPARGAELPPGMTCKYIRDIAVSIGASLQWDRERARAIAASYGMVLTEPQLDALRKCFT